MSLPRGWVNLPGPVDFLYTIIEDLVGRSAVLAGLPDEARDLFAVEIADVLKRKGIGRWSTVRATETGTLTPIQSMAKRSREHDTGALVLWVEATDQDTVAAWIHHVRECAELTEMPRICIASQIACAEGYGEEKRLRRRLWQDFITASDSRVLLERRGRRSGHNPAHVTLKSALIAELAGSDLVRAARLAEQSLSRILADVDHSRERIWAAQVSVLFPLVERERRRLLEDHRDTWRLPHVRKDGQEIQDLEKLEIGDMAAQARMIRSLGGEKKRIDWLHRVRNDLAHLDVVPWGMLTSPAALQIADFRENGGY